MDVVGIEKALGDINSIFSKILLYSNTSIDAETVSWHSYKSGIYKNIVYAAEYQKLIDTRQYSFLLSDKSFFQFYFKWDTGKVLKAKLAYYPAPVKITGALDDLLHLAEGSGIDIYEEIYFGAEGWVERGIDIVNSSNVRLDYDALVASHSKCHIQIASIDELRITSKYLLNPFNFFVWIVSNLNLPEFANIKINHHYIHSLSFHNARNLEIPYEFEVLQPYMSFDVR